MRNELVLDSVIAIVVSGFNQCYVDTVHVGGQGDQLVTGLNRNEDFRCRLSAHVASLLEMTNLRLENPEQKASYPFDSAEPAKHSYNAAKLISA